MSNSIFAPEPVKLRGDLTPAYLYARWIRYPHPSLCTKQIDFNLKELVHEFDISNVSWDELKPFYLEIHEYQERLKSDSEITLLVTGYGTVLRALRTSNEEFGERDSSESQKILMGYLEGFSSLRDEFLHVGFFINSVSQLIQNGASYIELYPCFYFAEDIARENIEPDEIEAIYLGAKASFTSSEQIAIFLIKQMNEIINRNKEKREFLGSVEKRLVTEPEEYGEIASRYLGLAIDLTLTAFKMIFR